MRFDLPDQVAWQYLGVSLLSLQIVFLSEELHEKEALKLLENGAFPGVVM